MCKLIKTESETLNLILKSLYVNEIWGSVSQYEEAELPLPKPENE